MPNNQYYDDRGNRRRDNDKVRFELIKHIGVLAEKDKGWKREVNLVAWNGGDVKVDIRDWDPDHRRMSKGITLKEEEACRLAETLAARYGIRMPLQAQQAPARPAAEAIAYASTPAAEPADSAEPDTAFGNSGLYDEEPEEAEAVD